MAAAHSPAAPHGGILRGRAARWGALALTALCLSACRQHRSIPEEDVEFAKRYLTLFSARSLPAIEMGMDPTMRDPQTRLRLMQMASVFPRGSHTPSTWSARTSRPPATLERRTLHSSTTTRNGTCSPTW